MNMQSLPAAELIVSDWLNTSTPISLAEQRGKVIVIEAFQMLCPGCVSHGLPQAQRIAETFASDDVLGFLAQTAKNPSHDGRLHLVSASSGASMEVSAGPCARAAPAPRAVDYSTPGS